MWALSTCGVPDEIELATIGVGLNGSGCVLRRLGVVLEVMHVVVARTVRQAPAPRVAC